MVYIIKLISIYSIILKNGELCRLMYQKMAKNVKKMAKKGQNKYNFYNE